MQISELQSCDLPLLITGKNGSGKSTVLNLLFSQVRNTMYLRQLFELFEDKTVLFNFKYLAVDLECASEFINKYKIDSSSKISELSLGQRQIVSIAIILSHEFELLILDEPFNNLSSSTIEILRLELSKYLDKLIIVDHLNVMNIENQVDVSEINYEI